MLQAAVRRDGCCGVVGDGVMMVSVEGLGSEKHDMLLFSSTIVLSVWKSGQLNGADIAGICRAARLGMLVEDRAGVDMCDSGRRVGRCGGCCV